MVYFTLKQTFEMLVWKGISPSPALASILESMLALCAKGTPEIPLDFMSLLCADTTVSHLPLARIAARLVELPLTTAVVTWFELLLRVVKNYRRFEVFVFVVQLSVPHLMQHMRWSNVAFQNLPLWLLKTKSDDTIWDALHKQRSDRNTACLSILEELFLGHHEPNAFHSCVPLFCTILDALDTSTKETTADATSLSSLTDLSNSSTFTSYQAESVRMRERVTHLLQILMFHSYVGYSQIYAPIVSRILNETALANTEVARRMKEKSWLSETSIGNPPPWVEGAWSSVVFRNLSFSIGQEVVCARIRGKKLMGGGVLVGYSFFIFYYFV